ncbi:MAG: protein kinase domain-containing protein [Kofleriaceae bacterium]
MSAPGVAGTRPSRLGRYELITRIGEGGMAEVQLALQRGPAGFEKLVVVKLVHENLATQKDFVDMLLDEARVAALVKHPNVVDIYDLGHSEGRFFIAMEYLEGEPLLAVLRAGREGKRLDILSTARLIADTAEGLDAAHELRSIAGDPLELVHHDVSLGNIVVLYNGQVKLVDFGVAKATQTVSTSRRVQGKFSYMAPEKLRGGAGDRRSDIWSLGCVLWEALTLKRLFKGGNDSDTMRQVLESEIPAPSTVNGDVLPELDPIVMRALERDPDRRYATAKEMAADLEEVLRKQAYGGKNDQIARYMQATFESHIAARKKLLQEVSQKGGASADVLEAAFDEGALVASAPMRGGHSGEFSVRFRNPQPTGEVHAEGTPSSRSGSVAALVPGSGGHAVVPAAVLPPAPAPRRSRLIVAIALVVAAAVVAIVIVAKRDGDEAPASGGAQPTQPSAPSTGSAIDQAAGQPTSDPSAGEANTAIGSDNAGSAQLESAAAQQGSAAIAEPDDATGSAQVAQPTSAHDPGASSETGTDGDDGSGATRHRPTSAPKPDAAALHKSGVQAFLHGDTRSALALLKRAQAANPSYAPTWRGLGSVYERLGDRAAAKAAYQRYLSLAPNAGDAAAIRAKLEQP